jgi:hypothetical protein
MEVSFCFTPGETPLTVRGWVGSRTSMDAVENNNLLPLSGAEPVLLCHPAGNPLLYGLIYSGFIMIYYKINTVYIKIHTRLSILRIALIIFSALISPAVCFCGLPPLPSEWSFGKVISEVTRDKSNPTVTSLGASSSPQHVLVERATCDTSAGGLCWAAVPMESSIRTFGRGLTYDSNYRR